MPSRDELCLSHSAPATRWGQAYPLGNGRLGGMAWLHPATDRLELTEHSFYSGGPSAENDRPGAAEAFYTMRRHTLAGDYEAAARAAACFVGRRGNYGTHLPLGRLWFTHAGAGEKASGYHRRLDVMRGLAEAGWQRCGRHYTQQVFASHPAGVLVWRLQCDGPGIDTTVALELHCGGTQSWHPQSHGPAEGAEGAGRTEDSGRTEGFNENGTLCFETQAREELHSDGSSGVRLWGCVRLATDGRLDWNGERLCVAGASYLTVALGAASDFAGDVSGAKAAYARAGAATAAAVARPFEQLLNEHVADVSTLMCRSRLELEGAEAQAATVPLMYQLGRYLLLCSSRANSLLPAHLQGIWNDNVACRIGWSCDMHLDINTQMNYWPAQLTSLEETAAPLHAWVCERLVPAGRVSAKNNYGLPGWVAELVSNPWGYTAPYWAGELAPWPSGGVWVLTHLWAQVEMNDDDDFLQRRAFGPIEEAVRFFTGYLFETDDGALSCGPSISPENSFVVGGRRYQASCGATGEVLMIRELFTIYEKACARLGVAPPLLNQVRALLPRLPGWRVLPGGTLAEWSHNHPAADPWHRHTSHLLGLFPFRQIRPGTAEAEAARRTLQAKLSGEWEDTGWARALMILYSARLGDGEDAWAHITAMLSGLLDENGMVIHPPTRGAPAFNNVYELDGNTGLVTGIAEMLLQSEPGRVWLLPALPAAWPNGRVCGLRAAGGITVELRWQNSRVVRAGFSCPRKKQLEVCWQGQTRSLKLAPGRVTELELGEEG